MILKRRIVIEFHAESDVLWVPSYVQASLIDTLYEVVGKLTARHNNDDSTVRISYSVENVETTP